MMTRPTLVSRGIFGVLKLGLKRGFFVAGASLDFAPSLDFAAGLSAVDFSAGFGADLLGSEA
jgi:hypothetical protein